MARPIDVEALAQSYRNLVLWFGAQLLLNMLSSMNRTKSPGAINVIFSLAILAAVLGTVVALIFYGYKTAQALGSSVAWLWALAMLVPCANILTLLALSSKATAACREHGIEVGFLGPKI